ncbi:MAG: hypothetical protein KY439_02550 [Actinobacteria bacterium]|nr:hypothetical protein [Actinomycetota bacterium]
MTKRVTSRLGGAVMEVIKRGAGPRWVASRWLFAATVLLLVSGLLGAASAETRRGNDRLSAGEGSERVVVGNNRPRASRGPVPLDAGTDAVPATLATTTTTPPVPVSVEAVPVPAPATTQQPRRTATPRPAAPKPATAAPFRAGPDCRGIFVLDHATARARKLADSPRGVHGPAWAPDGSHIAWAVAQETVQAVRPDGSEHRVLAKGRVNGRPQWMPDSAALLWPDFVDLRQPPEHDAFEFVLTDVAGGPGRVLNGDNPNGMVALSPVGTHIAYVATQNQTLRVMSIDGSDDRSLVDSIGTNPGWSPDGSLVTYQRSGGFALMAFDLGSGQHRTIYDGKVDQYAWAGRETVLVSSAGRILVLDAGTGRVAATITGSSPVWDPARERVLFKRTIDGPYNRVLEAALDGSGERVLIEDAGAQVDEISPAPHREGGLAFHCSIINSR